MYQINKIRKFLQIFSEQVLGSVLSEIDVAGNSNPCGGKQPPSELCKLMRKTPTLKKQISDEIYHNYKPFTAISKTHYFLQNVINAGKNRLAVPKPIFVIGLTIVKVLTINLRTKRKFTKKL